MDDEFGQWAAATIGDVSLKVTVDDLSDCLDEYGTATFVVTAGADSTLKVVHIHVG